MPTITPAWAVKFFHERDGGTAHRTVYISAASEDAATEQAFAFMEKEQARRIELSRVAFNPQDLPFGEKRWIP